MKISPKIKLILFLSLAVLIMCDTPPDFNLNDCLNNKMNSLSCEFYDDCLEKLYNCGEKGYPKGFGGKYCIKTLANMDRFDHDGLEWIRKSVPCLKKEVRDVIEHPEEYNCESVKIKAMRIHPDCYVESGFCKLLDWKNEKRFCKTIKGLLSIYELEDFTEKIVLEQIGTVLQMCRETGEHIDKGKVLYYASTKCGQKDIYEKVKNIDL